MIYDNSNPNSRPLPPSTPAKSDCASSPLTWIFGTVLVLATISIAGWALVPSNNNAVNNTVTSGAPASK
jgi:hypothetical protein